MPVSRHKCAPKGLPWLCGAMGTGAHASWTSRVLDYNLNFLRCRAIFRLLRSCWLFFRHPSSPISWVPKNALKCHKTSFVPHVCLPLARYGHKVIHMTSHTRFKARVCLRMASCGLGVHPMVTMPLTPWAPGVVDYNPHFYSFSGHFSTSPGSPILFVSHLLRVPTVLMVSPRCLIPSFIPHMCLPWLARFVGALDVIACLLGGPLWELVPDLWVPGAKDYKPHFY